MTDDLLERLLDTLGPTDDHLTAIGEATRAEQEAERNLRRARAELTRAMRRAQRAGVSISAIARAVGVTRKNVYKRLGRMRGERDGA